MAKTVMQRADEFAEREYIINKYEKERIAFGYYHGATEQRKVDKEKVYHALEKIVSKEVLKELIKIMEEEL